MTPGDDRVERLEHELARSGFGPLADPLDLIVSNVTIALRQVATTVSRSVVAHPLPALLLAAELGFLFGRLRRARR